MQCLGLYAANSMFVGDYLTTEGQAATEDFQLIEDLGFTVTQSGGPVANSSDRPDA